MLCFILEKKYQNFQYVLLKQYCVVETLRISCSMNDLYLLNWLTARPHLHWLEVWSLINHCNIANYRLIFVNLETWSLLGAFVIWLSNNRGWRLNVFLRDDEETHKDPREDTNICTNSNIRSYHLHWTALHLMELSSPLH